MNYWFSITNMLFVILVDDRLALRSEPIWVDKHERHYRCEGEIRNFSETVRIIVWKKRPIYALTHTMQMFYLCHNIFLTLIAPVFRLHYTALFRYICVSVCVFSVSKKSINLYERIKTYSAAAIPDISSAVVFNAKLIGVFKLLSNCIFVSGIERYNQTKPKSKFDWFVTLRLYYM